MKRKGNRPEGWRISFAAHKEVIQKYRNRWILCIMLLFTLTAGCGSSVSGTGTAPAGTSPSLTQEASDAAASSSAAQTDAALPGESAVPLRETTSQLAGSADPDSLFSGADLEGFFIETADGGFRVSDVCRLVGHEYDVAHKLSRQGAGADTRFVCHVGADARRSGACARRAALRGRGSRRKLQQLHPLSASGNGPCHADNEFPEKHFRLRPLQRRQPAYIRHPK